VQDLKERIIRGGFAKLCAQAATFLLRVGSLMVLARLLDPQDFGLVGMVTALMGVLNLFRDFGLSTATVQRVNVTEAQMSTLFWINVLVGVLLGLLAVVLAPAVVIFYHEPRLFGVTSVLAFGFLFNAAGVQHSAMLQRQMRFTTLAIIDIISLVVSIAVAIGMAVGGYGYWALVAMTLTSPLGATICLWLTTTWLPGRPRKQVGIRSMIRFGGMNTLNSLVVYIACNFEKILLGRFWGAEALGMYGRAYQFINMPTENLNSALGGIAFAALSRLQEDASRFKSYFLNFYSLVISLTLPITIACVLFSDDIVLLFLGPKWQNAAPIFRLLTPTILIFALVNPFSSFLLSLGMVGRSLKIALVLAPVMIAAYVLGLPYGPNGVAFAYSVVMTLSVIPLIATCIYGTMISPHDLLFTMGQPLVSATVGMLLTFAVQSCCGQFLSPFSRLTLGSGILLLSYLWMLLYVVGQKTFYLDLLRGLRKSSLTGDENIVKI
jgi:O-antigen/teichoic acid export membrane protein